MMTVQALQHKVGVAIDGDFGPATLKAARDFFGLTNEQAAHFFGQCHHETGGFRVFSENLNYSADGLLRIFPKHFPTMSVARAYARDPEAIANRAYANRMGNGQAASGDGWKYRGRGAIQLTGKATYKAFSESAPQYHLALDYAFDSAHWFFGKSGLWIAAKTLNDDTIANITRKINGGTHGLVDRITQTKRFYSWLI
jgi:putative chitinase